MPLARGGSRTIISGNIRELHGGKTYARTRAKSGKKRADKQAVAIALSEARKSWRNGRGNPGTIIGYKTP